VAQGSGPSVTALGPASLVCHGDTPTDKPKTGGAQPPILRDYQVETLARIDEAISAGARRILVSAPTGSGKTVTAAAIIGDAVARRDRVLFLDHRRELTRQASRKLHDAGIDHGIVQAGFPARPGAPVQVASVQTLHARAVRSRSIDLPAADLIIVDEAHHARARTWQRLLEAYPGAVIIGLTATPCRADGKGLGNVFDVLIETATVSDLITGGHLVPAKVFAPVRPDLTGVRVERGDYVEKQLAERMNTAKLVGDIIEHWHRLGGRRHTVIFAVNVAHSVHIRDEFRRSGVLAEHIDGSTPMDERDAILAKLATGTIEIITNCQVLTEGWDCPEVSCIVLARPTKSLGLYRQMVGRVLRPAPSKSDALILDHSGAVFMHGFVDDPIMWELSQDRRAENKAHSARGTYKAPVLKTCPECSAVRFEGQPCPVCHWHPVTKPRSVEVIDGELGAVSRDRNVAAVKFTTADKLLFHRQLAAIARERGYKDGWIAHKFRERFGDWPRARSVEPLTPDAATRSWVRSRQIAFARSRPPR
jgi:DNA repair protein RadD